MDKLIFETERLLVRPARAADVDIVYALWTNPQVMQHVGFPQGLRISREEVHEHISQCADLPFECVLIVMQKDTAVSIGQCFMHHPNQEGIAVTDVKLLPAFWGHKYGVEVKQGLVDYLFSNTNCVTVEGTPHVNNIASIKMQEAVGGVRVRESIYEFPEAMQDYTTPVHSIIYHVHRATWEKRMNAKEEVIELHQFFQDWFNGAIPQTDTQFARFADVLDASFGIVSPNGRFTSRQPLLDGLRGAYGRSRQRPGRIWIEQFAVQQTGADWLLANYEEWQTFDETTTCRISTVLFQADETCPNGWRWLHVHETWRDA